MGSNTWQPKQDQPFELTVDHLNALLPDQQPYLGGAVYPRGLTYEDEARPDTTYAQPLRKRMYLSPTSSRPTYLLSALSTGNQVIHAVADTAGKIWNLPNTLIAPDLGLGNNPCIN
ncbi:hypothetical protein [Aquirhabdus sp.]|uniref:hypothetical protein n=1 Tax=Aquirhabdus sp. TaxID=2824160 RepID=UPI00396CACBC